MNISDVPDENKEELSESSSVSPLSDFVFSLFWIALGCLIMLASWQMDRLEGQGSSLYTAPGSYPGLLGGVLLILGVLLAVRSYAAGGHRLGQIDFHFSKIHLTSFACWSFSCICPNLLRRFGGAQLDALLVGNFFICNHLYFFI